jgi:hypothetical protein
MDGDHLKMLILLGALLLGSPLYAAQLNLELGANSRTWQTEDLLKHPQAQTITINNDVSYKKDMSYRAVPLAALLTGIKPGDHLQAVALDGFAAELAAAPLLNAKGARAWLAIEEPAKPWPALSAGKPRAVAFSGGRHQAPGAGGRAFPGAAARSGAESGRPGQPGLRPLSEELSGVPPPQWCGGCSVWAGPEYPVQSDRVFRRGLP